MSKKSKKYILYNNIKIGSVLTHSKYVEKKKDVTVTHGSKRCGMVT